MLQNGTELKRGYHIERVLGQGGMGAVYLARQPSLGRLVAIKETLIRLEDEAARAAALESFRREAEILAAIEHPHLVDVKDYFEEAGSYYLVMSYIDGATLEDIVLQSPDPLPLGQVVEWVDQICDVLQYLHEHRPPVLVRDLKPSNVMVDAKGRVKLIDFGIARQQDGQATVGYLKGAGTVGFAPIEQFGASSTDERSDIYALGATMYFLLTRKVPPWSMQLATGEVCLERPSAVNPSVPPSLEAVVLRAMALRRDDRYQTVSLLRKALLQAAEGLPEGPRVATDNVGHRYCTECGAPLPPSVPACPACGRDRAAETGPLAPPPGGGPLPPSSGRFHVPQGMPLNPAAGARRPNLLLLMVVVVGIAVAAFFVFRDPSRGGGSGVVASGSVEPASTAPPTVRPHIGVEIRPPSLLDRRRLRLGGEGGLVVVRVETGGPAARAAISPQDVILSVDGVTVRTIDDLQREIQRHRQGDPVALRVSTRGAERTVSVTVE